MAKHRRVYIIHTPPGLVSHPIRGTEKHLPEAECSGLAILQIYNHRYHGEQCQWPPVVEVDVKKKTIH
jgi:hypothetical protein